jgi:elongator complex protein 3
MMANLLGATPAGDLADYRQLFDDSDLRPDELKVYPCSLIETAELMRHYRAGDYRPYSYEELSGVLEGMLEATPRYCRLSRVIRDISSGDIVAGNRLSNFREVAERRLLARGGTTADIRSREIKQQAFDASCVELRRTAYATSVGQEHFVELCTSDDRLLGFLRLSLPARESFVAELGRAAVIRELHVYGAALSLGARQANGVQHRGFGRRLLQEAERLAREAGYRRLAVISAVGTREYYRRRGFADGDLYQHRALDELNP